MLRKIRIILAVCFYTLITLLFLDFTGSLHAWFGWMAKIQFLPAVLAVNLGVVISLIVLTLVLGRVYCSIICPLGVFQDIVSWISGKRKTKKFRFTYSKEKKWLRYSVLGLFIILIVAGISSAVALLAPYSLYGRIVQNLFSPLWLLGNNLLAYLAERANSYAFYEKDIWIRSIPTFVIAAVSFVVIIVLAWRNGRVYCNTICPVGTVLGFLSKYSLIRPSINTDKCNGCGLCRKSCKASCINTQDHKIDYSRCVACMDCIDNCKNGAIRFQLRTKKLTKEIPHKEKESMDVGRRNMLTITTAVLATSILKAQEKKVDGGLAYIEDKKIPSRQTHIVPPGAQGIRNFSKHCTGCQLCVSACPNNVLRPSTSLLTLMQPEMSYERGYCRPECNKCSEVCPTGAIRPISLPDKSSTQIGHAVWIEKNCVVLTDNVSCGNCARHCPVGAITMVPSNPNDENSPKIPTVNSERCIGCGACENLCPARPFSAIYVEGHELHRLV